jgi:hypothetical protein
MKRAAQTDAAQCAADRRAEYGEGETETAHEDFMTNRGLAIDRRQTGDRTGRI